MSDERPAATIRPGERRDLAAINEIYNHYIRETEVAFDLEPWSMAQREAWFEEFTGSPRYRLFVAEAGDGRIIGFTSTRKYYPKAAYDTTVEVTIVLHPDIRRQGVGSQLYKALFAACRAQDIHRFVAFITASNEESIAFHEGFGFRHIGTWTEVGRKFGRYWDVALYERDGA